MVAPAESRRQKSMNDGQSGIALKRWGRREVSNRSFEADRSLARWNFDNSHGSKMQKMFSLWNRCIEWIGPRGIGSYFWRCKRSLWGWFDWHIMQSGATVKWAVVGLLVLNNNSSSHWVVVESSRAAAVRYQLVADADNVPIVLDPRSHKTCYPQR